MDEPLGPSERHWIGRIERPWQANVYVLVGTDGVVEVRHGENDQRTDPIHLDPREAAELAYHLLRGVEGETSYYHTPRPEDLARLRVAFRQVLAIHGREFREEVDRVSAVMYRDPKTASEAEDSHAVTR